MGHSPTVWSPSDLHGHPAPGAPSSWPVGCAQPSPSMNASGDQTVDVSTVRDGWCFSSGDSDSGYLHSCTFYECDMQTLVHQLKMCSY